MSVFETRMLTKPRYFINSPTKRHWREGSRIEDLDAGLTIGSRDAGLTTLVREVLTRQIRSIAIPPLGCGLGGLNSRDIEPLVERAFDSILVVRVLLFEPR